MFSVREQLKELTKQYEKSENDLKALQSVGQVRDDVFSGGKKTAIRCQCLHELNISCMCTKLGLFSQIVGEVLKQLTEEKCKFDL